MSLCKGSRGYAYLSDYSAILKWGARAYQEERARGVQPMANTQSRRYDNPHDFFEGGGV